MIKDTNTAVNTGPVPKIKPAFDPDVMDNPIDKKYWCNTTLRSAPTKINFHSFFVGFLTSFIAVKIVNTVRLAKNIRNAVMVTGRTSDTKYFTAGKLKPHMNITKTRIP